MSALVSNLRSRARCARCLLRHIVVDRRWAPGHKRGGPDQHHHRITAGRALGPSRIVTIAVLVVALVTAVTLAATVAGRTTTRTVFRSTPSADQVYSCGLGHPC